MINDCSNIIVDCPLTHAVHWPLVQSSDPLPRWLSDGLDALMATVGVQLVSMVLS